MHSLRLHCSHHSGQSRKFLLGRVALRNLQERLVLLSLVMVNLRLATG